VTRLTYHEGNHSYWLDDGAGRRDRAVSVSSLRKTLHTFEGERYYLGLAATAAADDWQRFNDLAPTSRQAELLAAAQYASTAPAAFGTAVHHYCAELWQGGRVELPAEYQGHVEAAARWWDAQQCKLIAAEQLCFTDGDDMRVPIAGRFDLLVDHPTRGVGLIDLKTWRAGSSGQPRKSEWAFQLAAYAGMSYAVDQAGDDVTMPRIDWAAVLHVGPPGVSLYTLPAAAWRRADDQIDLARALRALPKPTMTLEGEDDQ